MLLKGREGSRFAVASSCSGAGEQGVQRNAGSQHGALATMLPLDKPSVRPEECLVLQCVWVEVE